MIDITTNKENILSLPEGYVAKQEGDIIVVTKGPFQAGDILVAKNDKKLVVIF